MQSQNTPSADKLKVCPKCGVAKPYTTEFFSEKGGGLLRASCKDCISKQMRAYYEKNADTLRAKSKQHALEHVEEHKEYRRQYRVLNRERLTKKNKEYAEANPERARMWFRVAQARRRARKRANGGNYRAADVRDQMRRQKGKCYWCGVEVGKDYHVDHIVPVSRGGSNWPENLVIACPACNIAKSDKLPHEWPQGNRLL